MKVLVPLLRASFLFSASVRKGLLVAFLLLGGASLLYAQTHPKCCSNGPNLLEKYNPDFSDPVPPGGVPPGFQTDNRFVTAPTGSGTYLIVPSRNYGACAGTNRQYDHTVGDATGSFLWFDNPFTASATNPAVAWKPYDPSRPAGTQNLLDITPNTNYTFGVWVRDLGRNTDCRSGGAPDVGIRIDGVDVMRLDLGTITSPCCPEWQYLCYTWNSGNKKTVAIEVMSFSGQGFSDLGIDDVYFGTSTPVLFNLGNDTAICPGDSLILRSPFPKAVNTWSDGSTDSFIVVKTSGKYWLSVDDRFCLGADSINVEVKKGAVDLGNDTAICVGDSMSLDATTTGATGYRWSTGARTPVIEVYTPGTYWVKVEGDVCNDSGIVVVGGILLPVVDLGPDTTLCNEPSWTLKSRKAYNNPAYQWSNQAVTPSIDVHQSGRYKLTVTQDGCKGSDSVLITFDTVLVDLGNDTVLCEGQSVVLNSSLPYRRPAFHWSTGAVTSSIKVTDGGLYTLKVTDGDCSGIDSVRITIPHVAQNLGNDTTLCKEWPMDLTLQGNVPAGANALWSTGETTPDIHPKDSGRYWVTVTYPPCFGSDTVVIHTRQCNCQIFTPNAFSPNGDGLNDVFRPVMQDADCPIQHYGFRIYNRYGQMVYSSAKYGEGWDGTIAGKKADVGIYMYIVTYNTLLSSEVRVKRGDVTLIR